MIVICRKTSKGPVYVRCLEYGFVSRTRVLDSAKTFTCIGNATEFLENAKRIGHAINRKWQALDVNGRLKPKDQ